MINLEDIGYNNDESTYNDVSSKYMIEFQNRIRNDNLTNSVQVDKLLFPSIAEAVVDVKNKLSLECDIEAFVRNDAEIQAMCFAGAGNSISIALTSGLIRIYEPEELKFVIGHEIGHHLFQHYRLPQINDSSSKIEKLNLCALSRAAEITADRVGCIASNLDTALMAIVKLASGLPSSYIRRDFSSYLKQARKIHSSNFNLESLMYTHPSCPTRLRALLWFSMSQPYYQATVDQKKFKTKKAPLSKQQLNDKISKDLSSITGFKLDDINEKQFNESIKWGVFHIFSSDGKLSKVEQSLLKQIISETDVEKGILELKNYGPSKIKENFERSLKNLKFCDLKIRNELIEKLSYFLELTDGDKQIAKNIIQRSKNILNS